MPCDIFGFVEAVPLAGGPWLAAFALHDMVGCAGKYSDKVFGLSKHAQEGAAPFAHRGIPDDASREVRDWMASIARFENETGDDSSEFGHTYATLDELGRLPAPTDTAWRAVLGRMGELRCDANLSDAGIRIVLWANW